jgi:hypothetical protein
MYFYKNNLVFMEINKVHNFIDEIIAFLLDFFN